MTTNDVVIICTVFSLIFIATAMFCLIIVPIMDCYRYRKYLAFMREDVGHKMNCDERDEVREWYNNKLMLLRYSKLPNKHRILSPYQEFLVFFTVGVAIAFIPFCIYDSLHSDNFTNVFKIIFSTIRSFFWGSSFDKLQPIEGEFSTFYLHYMSIIFVVAGLVVASSIFKLFKEFLAHLKYWIIHPLSDIYVFSKLNEKSVALAEDVFKNGKPIKTVKKLSDRENNIEQEIFYVENEYKYNISHSKSSIDKKRAKEERGKKINELLGIAKAEKNEAKNAYKDAKSSYIYAKSNASGYSEHTVKQFKYYSVKAKNKYRSECLRYNDLLVNTVAKGARHVLAKIKAIFVNWGLFLICVIGTVLISVIFASSFLLIFIIYLLFFIPIEFFYSIGYILGFRTVPAIIRESYCKAWKRCQAMVTKIVLKIFWFFDSRSQLFDRLFHKRRIYFCDVYPQQKDSHDELIDRAKYIGATVMKRDVTELRMKWWCRSRTIYLISDNDNENTEHATYLQNSCTRSVTQKEMLNNSKTEIYVFASNDESEFVIDDLNNKLVKDRVEEIVSKYKDKECEFNCKDFDIMRVRRVNEYFNFATSFFWKRYDNFFYDVNDDKDIHELNIAMIGCGKYGREFVKTLCCLGQLPNYRLTIDIFDKDIERVKSSIPYELIKNGSSPLLIDAGANYLPVYSINFKRCSINSDDSDFLPTIRMNYTHIFVMLGDDELNIRTSMLLRKKCRREIALDKQPLIYTVVNDYQRHYNLKQGDELCQYCIKPIGRTVTRYSEQAIQQKDIENWARVIHTSFMLNDRLSDVLSAEDKNYSFKNCCEEYRQGEENGIPEDIFKLLEQMSVKPVVDEAYPIYLHMIYRSWQKIIAKRINSIDFDITYEIWNLICEIQNKMVDSYVEEFLKSYKSRIGEEVKQRIGNKNVDDETVQRLLTGLSNKIKDWYKKLKENIKCGTFIRFSDCFDFDKREYYRRSSKSRALYEHILFKKKMILYNVDNHKVKITRNLSSVRFSDEEWKKLEQEVGYSMLGIEDPSGQKTVKRKWEDGQWFVLNDLMQKRWMVFMWGEGYKYKESRTDDKKRTDAVEKTHRYLKPYIEIFRNENDKIRQTMEIIHVKE